ncbi:hypothetical protein [Nguyenibacter sp. L1]|uniref:NACHT domain-containing protein n=1 Tax=Nguyenibacter sp. L1 TaxID=3049350 RepID=UPI002B459BDB|nr:hypothetical protein [Nguyenibacter sp. L1]WRH87699.1 hypothetical protein QN315_17345 [Nguyenibacter sp. L1]
MISIQSLWALANQLGFDPAVLLTKTGERVITHAGGKVATAVGQRVAGSVHAVLSHWTKRINDSFPEYLRERLDEIDEERRPAIIEAAFVEWVQTHTNEAVELSRLLFRIVYLRALIDYCSDLPVVGGTESRLRLDDVWVPQAFRVVRPDQPQQRHADDLRFESLVEAVAACGAPFVLIGDSGAGKSTQLRKLVLDQARRQLETTDFDQLLAEPLPVYIRAETIARERVDLTTAITLAVSREMAVRLPFGVPTDFFDSRQPGAPRSLFTVVDGLDEISPESRDDLIAKIKSHGAAFNITLASRSALSQPGFAYVEIEEPTQEQAAALISRLTSGAYRHESIGLEDLPRNPLILTLSALMRRQKISSRAALYREFVIDRLGRSQELLLREAQIGFKLLEACANLESDLAGHAERLTAELGLLPKGLIGLARNRNAKALLVSTGIVRQDGERLTFIHESFRSYLRSEALARVHQPQIAPWRSISPFREGWEIIAFAIEIWRRDGQDTTSALEDLLAFGEPGLRLIAQLASRDPGLPTKVIDLAVDKWMHGSEDAWDPGHIDGPIQQLTLMAFHYRSARASLRKVAQDDWTYFEDAAYAAQGLAKAGLQSEARAFLMSLSRKAGAYCGSRVLAVEILINIGAEMEARACADELAAEWGSKPPDMDLSWMSLAEAFHKLGRKQAAIDILNRLDRELSGELDLSILAETYLAIGKPRKAKAAARRAFNTMKWSLMAKRGYDYDAAQIAALLDRVGASREASFVRNGLKKLENQASEALRAEATDCRRSATDRLGSALELLERHDDFGHTALEALLSDPGAPRDKRFSTVSYLLASSLREAVISTLKRVAIDEPWFRVSCGTALVLGGEPEKGCAILSRVAFEPAESTGERVEAIMQLAQSGRIDLAIAAFRRLRYSGDLNNRCLDPIANTFAHTSAWPEFLDHCGELLSSDNRALQIAVLNTLVRAKRVETDSTRAENLLRHIILDRELPPDLRIKAARQLDEMERGTALDLVFDITTSPDETMEAGIEAMQFLHYHDEFLAMDGGHDVVWDKKLSPDQFIEAAHAFLAMMRHSRDSTYEPLAGGNYGAMVEALQEIAADAAQPIERRFAAARLKDQNDASDRLHDPFWPGVDAICQDEATPIRLRWPAIRYALRKDPTRIERWRTVLDSGELGHLEAAYVYLAADWRDAAAERFHLALAEEAGLHIRVRIWKELVLLVEGPLAGREAATALSEALNSGQVNDLELELLEDLLLLSKAVLPTEEFIDLAKAVASQKGLSAYDITSVARTLVEYGAITIVRAIVGARKISLQKRLRTDDAALYELAHLHRLQAELGERDDAAKTLNDICSNTQLGISQRAFVCRILSELGRTGDARARLLRLSTRATTCADQLAIGRVAIDIHDWSLARRIFLAVAKSALAIPRERVNCVKGLAKVGLKENARGLLSSVDLIAQDLVWPDGIEALAACGQANRAIAICREYIERAEICTLDKMEALGSLGDTVSKEVARKLIVLLVSERGCDASACARGAELLHTFGFEAEARSILFTLATQPIPDVYDALWIADACLLCDLPFAADGILQSINSEVLDSELRQRYVELRSQVRIAHLGNESKYS